MILTKKFRKRVCVGHTRNEIEKWFKFKCPFCSGIEEHAVIQRGFLQGRTRVYFPLKKNSKCPFCDKTVFTVEISLLDIISGEISKESLEKVVCKWKKKN